MKKISKKEAEAIALSQHDLGGKGKEFMIVALSGETKEKRDVAFKLLDELSQLIVKTVLTADNLDEAEADFGYVIEQLKEVRTVIDEIR